MMSGLLRQRSPGLWEIQVDLGRDPLTGSYRSVSWIIHGSKRKAQEEIDRIVTSADNGKLQGTKANRTIAGRLGPVHRAIMRRRIPISLRSQTETLPPSWVGWLSA
jgi:hypothetical protein